MRVRFRRRFRLAPERGIVPVPVRVDGDARSPKLPQEPLPIGIVELAEEQDVNVALEANSLARSMQMKQIPRTLRGD